MLKPRRGWKHQSKANKDIEGSETIQKEDRSAKKSGKVIDRKNKSKARQDVGQAEDSFVKLAELPCGESEDFDVSTRL